MPNGLDLTNRIFHYLTVKRKTDERYYREIVWECLCKCGKTVFISTNRLTSGHTKSYSCYSIELFKQRLTKHGLSGTRAYINHCSSKRRATLLQQTPPWSESKDILELFKHSNNSIHIDHIIPLTAKLCKGLHVLANLEPLSGEVNEKKHNKFIPYSEICGVQTPFPSSDWAL